MDRILKMILRRLFNKGVNHGIKAAGGRANRGHDDSAKQRQMHRDRHQQANVLKKAIRVLRRINKL